MDVTRIDTLILGGGAAGLWLLDEFHRRGFTALLLEKDALGSGQTVASQGIIHGGIKYALTGVAADSARAVRLMPHVWRECLAGRREPDLSAVAVLSQRCFLWRTETVASRLGLLGARLGLHSDVVRVAKRDVPAPLQDCPGEVYSVDEPVIDVVSFLHVLAQRHQARIVKLSDAEEIQCSRRGPGGRRFVLRSAVPRQGEHELLCGHVILAAGAGNELLRQALGLPGAVMQRRPLHMILARGELPVLHGHCIDGARTRVTITTVADLRGTRVWQVGGEVAESGVNMERERLVQHAKRELRAAIPGVNLDGLEWTTYRVDRAEAKSSGGKRPAEMTIRQEGEILTVWPTKLALAPELARQVADRLGEPCGGRSVAEPLFPDRPRPEVAQPPWNTERTWQA